MTVCMVISLQKIPFVHVYTYKCIVLANPTHKPKYGDTWYGTQMSPTMHSSI